jgi:hypothetical protein
MNKTVNLFVLAGCWECQDDIGVTVVAISSDEKQLIDRLDQIADTQAKEYVSIEGSILMEEHTDTRYEISGGHQRQCKVLHHGRTCSNQRGTYGRNQQSNERERQN